MRCSPLTWWAISCSRRAFLGSAGINIPSALRDVILHRSCDMSGPTFGPMHMRSVTPLGRAFRTRWFECCCALFARQDCARSGCKDATANRQQDVRRSSQPAERLPRRCPTVLWPWSRSATLSAREQSPPGAKVASASVGALKCCFSSTCRPFGVAFDGFPGDFSTERPRAAWGVPWRPPDAFGRLPSAHPGRRNAYECGGKILIQMY